MGYRYQKEVDALQLVSESNQWRQKIRTILFYVQDHPNLPVKRVFITVSGFSLSLAENARKPWFAWLSRPPYTL